MARSWTVEEIKKDIAQSARGEEILRDCEESGCQIEERTPSQDPNLSEGVAGYFSADANTIVLNSELSRDQAINTLAHEGEHEKQFRNEEFPKVERHSDPQNYINEDLQTEARAETSSNQVAYELAQKGDTGPLEAKLNGAYKAQTESYVDSRTRGGASHEEAAEISEPSWSENPNASEYADESLAEWNRVESNYNASFTDHRREAESETAPETESTNQPNSEAVPDWKAKWIDHAENTKIPDPPPPPEPSQDQSQGHGR